MLGLSANRDGNTRMSCLNPPGTPGTVSELNLQRSQTAGAALAMDAGKPQYKSRQGLKKKVTSSMRAATI